MDQKFWEKIDNFGQNGEYDKIINYSFTFYIIPYFNKF